LYFVFNLPGKHFAASNYENRYIPENYVVPAYRSKVLNREKSFSKTILPLLLNFQIESNGKVLYVIVQPFLGAGIFIKICCNCYVMVLCLFLNFMACG
jgi:hypothetical protein